MAYKALILSNLHVGYYLYLYLLFTTVIKQQDLSCVCLIGLPYM
jgi:hypothetical protein